MEVFWLLYKCKWLQKLSSHNFRKCEEVIIVFWFWIIVKKFTMLLQWWGGLGTCVEPGECMHMLWWRLCFCYKAAHEAVAGRYWVTLFQFRASEQPVGLSSQPCCSSTPAAERGPWSQPWGISSVIAKLFCLLSKVHPADIFLVWCGRQDWFWWNCLKGYVQSELSSTLTFDFYCKVTCSCRRLVWTGTALHKVKI